MCYARVTTGTKLYVSGGEHKDLPAGAILLIVAPEHKGRVHVRAFTDEKGEFVTIDAEDWPMSTPPITETQYTAGTVAPGTYTS